MSTSTPHNDPPPVFLLARTLRPPRFRRVRRKCLRCQQLFSSSWCGNRICRRCAPALAELA